MRSIFEQPDERAAREQFDGVIDSLETRFAAVARLLLEAELDLLAHFTFPETRRRQIRSTNPLERLNKEITSAGMAIMVLGLLSLTELPVDFALPDLVWRLVLLGVGQGMFMSPNSSAVLGSVPRPRVGTSSGTLAQMRVNGQALGIALSGAIVATRLPVHLAALGGGAPTAAVRSAALAGAIHDAFVVAALVCCLAVVTSLVRGR